MIVILTSPVIVWNDLRTVPPPIQQFISGQGWQPQPPYVLAVDAKDRMSVGYARENSEGYTWVFAKPIGEPTHWTPLPIPPIRRGHTSACGLKSDHEGECKAVVTRLLGV
jgi:hypothetical protein